MIMIKKIFLCFLGLILIQSAHAQIYSSDVCFYIKTGESLEKNNGITYILFDGSRLITSSHTSYYVKKSLREDPNFFYNYLKNIDSNSEGNFYKYSSSKSKPKREVYIYRYPGYHDYFLNYAPHWRCIAVSPDKNSFISWTEYDDGTISGKQYYIRIDKKELLPKISDYDFLYE